MAALGLIEVIGMVSAITTLDTMLKAAQVERLAVEKVRGGLVAVLVTGDVGAVRAAVDAGLSTAREFGTVISCHVIPRPAAMTEQMLEPLRKKKNKAEVEQVEPDRQAAEEMTVETAVEIATVQSNEQPVAENNDEIDRPEPVTGSVSAMSPEMLQSMKVVDLRNLARELDLQSMTREEIKFARKGELIEAIMQRLEER